jgi:hypothetical protein
MGRWYCGNKATAESCSDILIFRLNGWGYLQGWHSGTLTWTRSLSGTKSSIGITVDVMGEPHARLQYTSTTAAMAANVTMTTTALTL